MTGLALHGGPPAVTVPHPRAWPWLSPAARERVDRLLDAGETFDYALGDTLAEFETVVREYQGMPFALGAASGTAALHMAFYGVGIRPGDEVIVPSYTFHATVAPLFLLSAVPVLCDVDPLTGNIDPADVRRHITDRTRAIVVTHMWGHPAQVDELRAIAGRNGGLRIVEDGSHAHGARHNDRLVGTFGDAAAFSLGARKMVSGGLGGVMVTADEEVFRTALPLGHCHERAELTLPAPDVAVGYGANYRLSPVAAAICTEQYRDLDERIAVKAEVLDGLSRRLRDVPGLRAPYTAGHVTRGGWYGYKARYVPEELDNCPIERVIEALRAEGLRVDRPSNVPLHWQEIFAGDELLPGYYRPGRPRPHYRRGDLPGAEAYYRSSLSFPAPYLHEPDEALLDQYLAGIVKVVKNIGSL